MEAGGIAQDAAVISLMLNTGIRVSELCFLKWKDVRVSDEAGMLTVYISKQDKRVQVPLNKAARKALLALGPPQQLEMSEQVFTGQYGLMTRRGVVVLLNRYSKIANLNNFTPAMLRNTFLQESC